MIKAVILDIGGPLNDETEQERLFDDAALDAIRQQREVAAEEYVEVCDRVVRSFAPRAYRAILWDLAGRDQERFGELCHAVRQRQFERFNLRPEMPEILEQLSGRYKLGIAANSGPEMIERFHEAGILKHFTSHQTAGMVEFYKPDLRYFQLVLKELQVEAEHAVMVGDRIDCDIVPGRTLGMKTVRLRVGRHNDQEARMPTEVPDYEILSMRELPEVLARWP